MDIVSIIKEAAARHGIDERLALAVANQESGYNPYIVSPAGAIGVMQLMPGTAEGLGVDPWDAWENIDGGVRYLKAKLQEFGGDVTLALAAYNAGSGAVQKYGGVPPYQETQNYIKSITSALGGSLEGLGDAAPDTWPPAGVPADAPAPEAPYWKRWLYYQKLLFTGRWKEAEAYRGTWVVEYTDPETGETVKRPESEISKEAGEKVTAGNGWIEGKVKAAFVLVAGLVLAVAGVAILARGEAVKLIKAD